MNTNIDPGTKIPKGTEVPSTLQELTQKTEEETKSKLVYFRLVSPVSKEEFKTLLPKLRSLVGPSIEESELFETLNRHLTRVYKETHKDPDGTQYVSENNPYFKPGSTDVLVLPRVCCKRETEFFSFNICSSRADCILGVYRSFEIKNKQIPMPKPFYLQTKQQYVTNRKEIKLRMLEASDKRLALNEAYMRRHSLKPEDAEDTFLYPPSFSEEEPTVQDPDKILFVEKSLEESVRRSAISRLVQNHKHSKHSKAS